MRNSQRYDFKGHLKSGSRWGDDLSPLSGLFLLTEAHTESSGDYVSFADIELCVMCHLWTLCCCVVCHMLCAVCHLWTLCCCVVCHLCVVSTLCWFVGRFALTKLDILDDQPLIKIGAAYLVNGCKIDYYPSTCASIMCFKKYTTQLWLDPDAVCGYKWGWSRDGCIRWGWWLSKGKGSFGVSHCCIVVRKCVNQSSCRWR